MEYQGFTGSNYEEDDRERAKHGGSIGGFGRKTLPPGYGDEMQPLINARLEQLKNATIDVKEPEEFKNLDDIKAKIMMRKRVLDSLLESQDPMQQDKIDELQRQQQVDEDMYNLDPMSEQHSKARMQEEERMPDAPPSFKRLNKLMR